MSKQAQRPAPPDPATLEIVVYSALSVEPKTFSWARQTTVGQAADEAAAAFRYEGGTPTLQTEDGTVLDRGTRLAATRLRDGDTVELVDVGGGV